MRLTIFMVSISVVLLGISCNQYIDPPSNETDYFPLQPGKYIIYDMDSLDFNDFNSAPVSSHFQIMEQVDSAYNGSNGETLYRIVRSRRNTESDLWQITDIWSANADEKTAEKVEENLRYVKLDFPIIAGKNWLGNILISDPDSLIPQLAPYDFQNWEYKYTEAHVPKIVNGLPFDSVVVITQINDTTAIDTLVFMEYYARHIGLIYKREDFRKRGSNNSAIPFGHILEMKIQEYN